MRLFKGDATYPEHVSIVLKDTTIDCAILETSREGILRSGLGYKFADFGIVLNMLDDHVGADDIKYIEDLAYAKSVVAEEVYEEGFTILNADDPYVIEMMERLYSKPVLFSKQRDNKLLQDHIGKGGLSVFLDEGWIHLSRNKEEVRLVGWNDIPMSFNGKAAFMLDSVLAVTATLAAYGISDEAVALHLLSFVPGQDTLPGRMNMIPFGEVTLLIDNAHNAPAFEGLQSFLSHYECFKTGVIDAAGDRSDAEITRLGNIAAATYQRVYIFESLDRRGRAEGEIPTLLSKGLTEAGMKEDAIKLFSTPEEAWQQAVADASPGSMVVILTSDYERTLGSLSQYITG